MGIPICANCNRLMRCEKNEVTVAPVGMNPDYPDHIQAADRYVCTECGARVLTGFSQGHWPMEVAQAHLAAGHFISHPFKDPLYPARVAEDLHVHVRQQAQAGVRAAIEQRQALRPKRPGNSPRAQVPADASESHCSHGSTAGEGG